MIDIVYKWRNRLGVLGECLLPLRCLICEEPGAEGRDLCRACHAALPWNVPACRICALPLASSNPVCGPCLRRSNRPLDETHAVFSYRFPLDRLLPRFKFHRDLAAGRLLSMLMAGDCAGLPRPDAIVPIPLHWRRLSSRGYDQALELARPLARMLRIPLRGDLLRRVRSTRPQSELDAAERRRNLRAAFTVRAPPPAHVVLLDDVMTTGATLEAAARGLRAAGARRIDAWVCARTL
ncbi:MAG: ComF family protein [Xanthomonadaceae bacterium]|jgi:ComF family protein|nr:ComF family protein [Xanthomonadaceae bacterium]